MRISGRRTIAATAERALVKHKPTSPTSRKDYQRGCSTDPHKRSSMDSLRGSPDGSPIVRPSVSAMGSLEMFPKGSIKGVPGGHSFWNCFVWGSQGIC